MTTATDNPRVFELKYQSGGHGGPYTLTEARETARRYLDSSRGYGDWIDIHRGLPGAFVERVSFSWSACDERRSADARRDR